MGLTLSTASRGFANCWKMTRSRVTLQASRPGSSDESESGDEDGNKSPQSVQSEGVPTRGRKLEQSRY